MGQEAQRYERNVDFIFRRIVDEVVLVPIRQNVAEMDAIYTMNPVAAFIWEELKGPRTLAELEAAVVGEFDVAAEAAGADVHEFVQQLEAAGAVQRA